MKRKARGIEILTQKEEMECIVAEYYRRIYTLSRSNLRSMITDPTPTPFFSERK